MVLALAVDHPGARLIPALWPSPLPDGYPSSAPVAGWAQLNVRVRRWKGAISPPSFRLLPGWRRTAFSGLFLWLEKPPAPRAILLSGARQVGKTTLLLQAVEELLARGVRPERILYATFDHPLHKLIGLEGVLDVWREEVAAAGAPPALSFAISPFSSSRRARMSL